MRFGSLFTGIAGLDLGLERAGLDCQWQVELDGYCRQVLDRHWPDIPKHVDVRDVGAHNLAPVDVICGGFPCQDISSAGHGAGIEGARSGLWSEYLRIVRELRPGYIVVENVEALRHRGRGLYRVLGDLAACGYDAQWDVLPAAGVGAPHLRERLFIVAYAGGQRWPDEPALFQAPDQSQVFEPWASGEGFQSVVSARCTLGRIPEDLRKPDGLPFGMERIRGCGNAVVPQIAEHVGRCLLAFDRARHAA